MRKRYIKLVIRDEHGSSEDVIRDASEDMMFAARRLSAQFMSNEPITDAEWAETIARVKAEAEAADANERTF